MASRFEELLDIVAIKSQIFHENAGMFAKFMHPGLMFVLMIGSLSGLFGTDSYGVAILLFIIGAGAFILQVIGSARHIRGI